MERLIAQVSRFNRWYDGLAAGPRFSLFMAMMLGSVFLLNLGLTLENAASKYLVSIGLVNTMFVGWIAVIRANGLGGHHKLIAKILGYMLIAVLIMVAIIS